MKIFYKKLPLIYRVEDENISQIASKLGTNVLSILKYNDIKSVSKGDYIEIPNDRVYVVKPLDTIRGICNKLDITPQELFNKNKITQIFIGQVLFY